MSMLLMVKAMQTKVGNPLRKLVLIKLADNANDQGECWPSYQHIADQCEIDRSTVRKHIKSLADAGLLTIENRDGPKGNSSNVYTLTLDFKPKQTSTPVGPESTPVGPESTPVGPESTPPVGPESTRTSHYLESTNETVIEPTARKQKNTFSLPAGLNLDAWSLWMQYRIDRKLKTYKQTTLGAGAVAKNLIELAGGDLSMQMRIVLQSINNQWQGLFELKEWSQPNQSKIHQAQQAARRAIASGSVSYDPNIPFDRQ